jgi:WD40 repeat protein
VEVTRYSYISVILLSDVSLRLAITEQLRSSLIFSPRYRVFIAHDRYINLLLEPPNKHLISGGIDKTKLWDGNNAYKCIYVVNVETFVNSFMFVKPCYLAYCYNENIKLLNIYDNYLHVHTLEGHRDGYVFKGILRWEYYSGSKDKSIRYGMRKEDLNVFE